MDSGRLSTGIPSENLSRIPGIIRQERLQTIHDVNEAGDISDGIAKVYSLMSSTCEELQSNLSPNFQYSTHVSWVDANDLVIK